MLSQGALGGGRPIDPRPGGGDKTIIGSLGSGNLGDRQKKPAINTIMRQPTDQANNSMSYASKVGQSSAPRPNITNNVLQIVMEFKPDHTRKPLTKENILKMYQSFRMEIQN